MNPAVRGRLGVLRISHLKPDTHASGSIADDDRAIPQEPRQCANCYASRLTGAKRISECRTFRFTDLPVIHLAGTCPGEEVGLIPIQS